MKVLVVECQCSALVNHRQGCGPDAMRSQKYWEHDILLDRMEHDGLNIVHTRPGREGEWQGWVISKEDIKTLFLPTEEDLIEL